MYACLCYGFNPLKVAKMTSACDICIDMGAKSLGNASVAAACVRESPRPFRWRFALRVALNFELESGGE